MCESLKVISYLSDDFQIFGHKSPKYIICICAKYKFLSTNYFSIGVMRLLVKYINELLESKISKISKCKTT